MEDAESSVASSTSVLELRREVSRVTARAKVLGQRLDETVKRNRWLEKEVAQAVKLGVSELLRRLFVIGLAGRYFFVHYLLFSTRVHALGSFGSDITYSCAL